MPNLAAAEKFNGYTDLAQRYNVRVIAGFAPQSTGVLVIAGLTRNPWWWLAKMDAGSGPGMTKTGPKPRMTNHSAAPGRQ